jgi:hypothetical protein
MTMVAWEPEVEPQSPEEAPRGRSHPSIVDAAVERGITSVVHFTRTSALKGILGSGVVKARRDLPDDARVKHVYRDNAADRSRDLAWHGYINLSVSANREMFNSSKGWHPGDE